MKEEGLYFIEVDPNGLVFNKDMITLKKLEDFIWAAKKYIFFTKGDQVTLYYPFFSSFILICNTDIKALKKMGVEI